MSWLRKSRKGDRLRRLRPAAPSNSLTAKVAPEERCCLIRREFCEVGEVVRWSDEQNENFEPSFPAEFCHKKAGDKEKIKNKLKAKECSDYLPSRMKKLLVVVLIFLNNGECLTFAINLHFT